MMHSHATHILVLTLLASTAACQTRDRPPLEPPACGAPGTNTVVQENDCYCVAGHVLDGTGSTCVPATPDMTDDGGTATDGAPPEPVDAGPTAEGTLREVDTSDGTCAAGCSAAGFPCATSCEQGAGYASYGYYDWDYGLYRSVHQSNLATCEQTPAPTHAQDGETYEMGRLVCCCEIPEITRESATPADVRTCDQICLDAGHEGCADFAEWSNEDAHGGTLATYYRAKTGSVTDVVMGCAANPPLMRRIAGAERQLRGYRCACL